jgi:hypothetical protein
MHIDKTTKVLLSIIAVCLLYFVGKDIVAPATAGPEIVAVDIVKIDGRDISPFGTPLPVEIVKK